VQVPYDNGTFGARLVRVPEPGSPAAQLQLEPGDTIFELDGTRFRTPNDVLSHRALTTMRFINVRTNGTQSATVWIP
jgi:S1-C subfamily serine protease